jgi:hypothetical protein
MQQGQQRLGVLLLGPLGALVPLVLQQAGHQLLQGARHLGAQ